MAGHPAVYAFQVVYNQQRPASRLREHGKFDERTIAAIRSPLTPPLAVQAFQKTWNQSTLVPLSEDGKHSPSIERIITQLAGGINPMIPSPALFSALSATLRKEIPLAGLRGYDLAIRTATQQITPIALQTTLSHMTDAERKGFSLGTALKMGIQHPSFHAMLYNIAKNVNPQVQVGAGAPLPPDPTSGPTASGGVYSSLYNQTFSAAQVAAMTAAYNARQAAPPPAPGSAAAAIAAMNAQWAQAAIDLTNGKAPANAQEAATQQTVAMLVTGAAIGVSSPYLGNSAILAAGQVAKQNPVIATGIQATGTAVSTGLFARLFAWFKNLIHHSAATAPVATPLSQASAPTIKPKVTF